MAIRTQLRGPRRAPRVASVLPAVLLGLAITLSPASLARPAAAAEPAQPADATPAPAPTPTPWPKPSVIATAIVAPISRLPAGAFRATAYTLPRLPWASLPYNGMGLPSTALTGTNLDSQGIPYKMVSGRPYYSPGSIAMQGARFVDAYVRTGNPIYLDRAERRAARLRLLAFSGRGATWLAYKFNYLAEGLHAPWVSALSQGAALSFFVRLYRVTGSARDLATARAIFLSFRAIGRVNPWVGYVDAAGYLRLEEYPGPHPSHVFNGANFAYFGIYDYAMLTGDPTAVQLARGHLTAMRQYTARYRVAGGLSYYDLTHYTRSVHYHAVDRWQLLMLARMGGGYFFAYYNRLFTLDYAGGTYP